MPRIPSTVGVTAAAVALAGLALFGAASAAADPTPGYPGGYPGGYTGGGTTGGGISTTNSRPGGPVTVTAACATGAGATLTFDGTAIASAAVTGGSAVLTGTVPAGATGSHTVVATCDSGKTYSFAVTVGAGTGSNPSGSLASTGAKVATFAGGGIVLVAAGVGLVLLARRRHHTTA